MPAVEGARAGRALARKQTLAGDVGFGAKSQAAKIIAAKPISAAGPAA
jgi:hypothetical protein